MKVKLFQMGITKVYKNLAKFSKNYLKWLKFNLNLYGSFLKIFKLLYAISGVRHRFQKIHII